MRVHMFATGVTKTRVGLIKIRAGEADYTIPIPWYLNKHPQVNVAFDSGISAEVDYCNAKHHNGGPVGGRQELLRGFLQQRCGKHARLPHRRSRVEGAGAADVPAVGVRHGKAHGINRASTDVAKEVLRLTGGRGADHVLDLVGGENFTRSVEAVSVGGRISGIGLLGGMELRAPTTPVLLKAPVIQGIVTGHRRALQDLVRAVDRIGLKPVIDRYYPFDELPVALDHLDNGAFGKIVIDMPMHGS